MHLETARVTSRRVERDSWIWRAAFTVVFGGVVFALGDLAVRLAPAGSNVAAWWPAAGVAVAVLVRAWGERWLLASAIVVFTALANVAGGRTWGMALGFALSNAAEALVAAWFLRRCSGGEPGLHRLRQVAYLAMSAALGAAAIATGVALTLGLTGEGIDWSVLRVVPSHAAAVLLIVPMTLPAPPATRRSPLEIVVCWTFDLVAVAFVFSPHQRGPLVFVLVVPLVWSAIRLGVRHVCAQLLAVGVAVTMLTANGRGPFATAAADAAGSNWSVQLFLVSSAVIVVLMATAVAERGSALERVRASEELFRRGFDEALVGMILVRVEGRSVRVAQVNQAAERSLGMTQGDLVDGNLSNDEGRTLAEVIRDLRPGEGWRGEMETAGERESARHFLASLSRLTGDGAGLATCQLTDVTAKHRTEMEMERLALRDHLTGLPNRVFLEQRLSAVLVDAAAASTGVALMFIDLDDFKMVNDTAGHHQGDHILVEIGRRLAGCVRSEDTVARMGGDEFVVVCPGVETVADAIALSERIWPACERPVEINDLAYNVDLSIGLAVSTPEATKSELLSQADIALYAAKAAGKRRTVVYTADMGVAAAEQVRLEAELRLALDQQQLMVYLQPVLDLDDGSVAAAEALVRWRHPERGLLLPGSFVPVAERSGLMPDIGAWVLDESCRLAATWITDVGVEHAPTVHVNVSARQLDRLGLADVVMSAVRRHGLPPEKLVLELTESYLAEIDETLIDEFERLTAFGVRFAADDYGTGYSPLTRIIELPIRMIKIDQRFVRAITDDRRALAIVGSLARLAESLDLEAVAEGVESPRHASILRDLGIRYAQGHLWHPALPPEVFRALLRGVGEPAAPVTRALAV